MKRLGWRYESARHSLAAKGVRTKSWSSGLSSTKGDNRAYMDKLKREGYGEKFYVDTVSGRVVAGFSEKKGLRSRVIDIDLVDKKKYMAKKGEYPDSYLDSLGTPEEKVEGIMSHELSLKNGKSHGPWVWNEKDQRYYFDEEKKKELDRAHNREAIRESGWSQNERQIMKEAEEKVDRVRPFKVYIDAETKKINDSMNLSKEAAKKGKVAEADSHLEEALFYKERRDNMLAERRESEKFMKRKDEDS